MEIVWTNQASKTHRENIEYLLNQWTYKEVHNFNDEVIKIANLLKKNSKLGKWDEDWKCYKILVIKPITLYYTIEEKKIVLITFWNNYKKPKH